LPHWVDCEFSGRDFRDEDLSRLRTERAVFSECDFTGANLAESDHRGSAFGAASRRTASLSGARVDVPQAMAFALAHGLRLNAGRD